MRDINVGTAANPRRRVARMAYCGTNLNFANVILIHCARLRHH
jgi:hypothetical protein